MADPVSMGALPALVTPLTPSRGVDADGVTALVRRALADGASGVLVAGSTGEGALLDAGQRERVTALARAAIDTHGPVATLVAGACGLSVDAVCEDVTRQARAGADRVLVLAPHTYRLSPDELADLHREVADRCAVPTLIYHIPQLTGSELTPDAVARLAEHPDIVGMKDSSSDAERRAAFAAGPGGRDDFVVLTGHAPTLRAALDAGVDGSITAVANVRMWQVVALHAAVAEGDDTRARRLQVALARLSDGLGGSGSSAPAMLKAALQLDGVIAERWCRFPLRSVEPRHLDQVRTALLS